MKYYLIQMLGCIDPQAHGPYATKKERTAALKQRIAEDSDLRYEDGEDSIFSLDVNPDGTITVASYSGGYMNALRREAGVPVDDADCFDLTALETEDEDE